MEVVDDKAITSWGGPSVSIYDSDGMKIAIVPLQWDYRRRPDIREAQ